MVEVQGGAGEGAAAVVVTALPLQLLYRLVEGEELAHQGQVLFHQGAL